MDYPSSGVSDTPKLRDDIANIKSLVREIKVHVIESMPANELETAKNPMANHKLINIKSSLDDIARELEQILQAVISL